MEDSIGSWSSFGLTMRPPTRRIRVLLALKHVGDLPSARLGMAGQMGAQSRRRTVALRRVLNQYPWAHIEG